MLIFNFKITSTSLKNLNPIFLQFQIYFNSIILISSRFSDLYDSNKELFTQDLKTNDPEHSHPSIGTTSQIASSHIPTTIISCQPPRFAPYPNSFTLSKVSTPPQSTSLNFRQFTWQHQYFLHPKTPSLWNLPTNSHLVLSYLLQSLLQI